jgi:hypothetical protein
MVTSIRKRSPTMAEKIPPKERVEFKELLIANVVEIQAISQLLMEKG